MKNVKKLISKLLIVGLVSLPVNRVSSEENFYHEQRDNDLSLGIIANLSEETFKEEAEESQVNFEEDNSEVERWIEEYSDGRIVMKEKTKKTHDFFTMKNVPAYVYFGIGFIGLFLILHFSSKAKDNRYETRGEYLQR